MNPITYLNKELLNQMSASIMGGDVCAINIASK
jgi:hypothetical protein